MAAFHAAVAESNGDMGVNSRVAVLAFGDIADEGNNFSFAVNGDFAIGVLGRIVPAEEAGIDGPDAGEMAGADVVFARESGLL